jgi:hypothetical protein
LSVRSCLCMVGVRASLNHSTAPNNSFIRSAAEVFNSAQAFGYPFSSASSWAQLGYH